MNIKRLLAVILAVLALLSFVGCNVKKGFNSNFSG